MTENYNCFSMLCNEHDFGLTETYNKLINGHLATNYMENEKDDERELKVHNDTEYVDEIAMQTEVRK